jgi:lysophospholipid acyltransferase (LPLAT)-like uncharacterized protein
MSCCFAFFAVFLYLCALRGQKLDAKIAPRAKYTKQFSDNSHPVPLLNTRYNSRVNASAEPQTQNAPSAPAQKFTLRQRVLLWLITWTGVAVIRAIGPTLRVEYSFEEGAPAEGIRARPVIASFWHNCIFPAVYLCRDLSIRVMSSDSFDGEWTGRIIRKFGFVKVRGSSSRGAIRGLIGMRREIEQGWSVAFTIDGPRGPRYVAKPGPVLLAQTTGAPMVPFYVALEKAWILKTWDGCMIPKPFSRALLRLGREVHVPPGGDRDHFLAELQASLERVREFAEENIKKMDNEKAAPADRQ